MPRTKKSFGTAVDRRNGRQLEVPAGGLKRFALPRGRAYRRESAAAWRTAWTDPAAQMWTPGDRPILLRWILHLDLHYAALDEALADPIVPGHARQPVRSPWFEIAGQYMGVVVECERQLGFGAWNRARLGLVVATGRLTLDQLNAQWEADRLPYDPGLDDDPRIDPAAAPRQP